VRGDAWGSGRTRGAQDSWGAGRERDTGMVGRHGGAEQDARAESRRDLVDDRDIKAHLKPNTILSTPSTTLTPPGTSVSL
jgi:hypothetical protein